MEIFEIKIIREVVTIRGVRTTGAGNNPNAKKSESHEGAELGHTTDHGNVPKGGWASTTKSTEEISPVYNTPKVRLRERFTLVKKRMSPYWRSFWLWTGRAVLIITVLGLL